MQHAQAPDAARLAPRTRSPRAAALPAALVALLLASGCAAPNPDDAGAAPQSQLDIPAAGWRHEALDGMAYHVWVPAGLAAPSALVVFLHGLDENAAVAAAYTGILEVANETGFVVVLPEKSPKVPGTRGGIWREDEGATRRDEGDAGAIAQIVATVQAQIPILDHERTYVAGFSGGGFMASVMGALYPDVFSGIAIGSAGPYRSGDSPLGNGAAPLLVEARAPPDPHEAGREAYVAMGEHARRLPVFVVHGTDDPFFGPEAGARAASQWAVTNDLADDGEENGSVPQKPQVSQATEPGGHNYSIACYEDDAGHVIQYWLVEGMQHAWPGRDAEFGDPNGPDATRTMMAFLDQDATCGEA